MKKKRKNRKGHSQPFGGRGGRNQKQKTCDRLIFLILTMKEPGERCNPEDAASFASRASMLWIDPLIRLGARRPLVQPDLEPIARQDEAKANGAKFSEAWTAERAKPKPSVFSAAVNAVGRRRLVSAFLAYACKAGMQFGPVLMMKALVRHLEGTEQLTLTQQWLCVGGLFVTPAVAGIFEAWHSTILAHIAANWRSMLQLELFGKALALSPTARGATSTGQIVNLYAADSMAADGLFMKVSG